METQKILFVLVAFTVAVATAEDEVLSDARYCYNRAIENCHEKDADKPDCCSALYGGYEEAENKFQNLANDLISNSFKYLLMSTYFGNYQKNREGFQKYFRKLSDSTWEDGIDVIKHITKRGGKMNFKSHTPEFAKVTSTEPEISEFQSMSLAVDIQKSFAKSIHETHKHVSKTNDKHHDPELASFLENEFVHKNADIIRELSGHANDLAKLMTGSQCSVSLFLFDEYLQSIL